MESIDPIILEKLFIAHKEKLSEITRRVWEEISAIRGSLTCCLNDQIDELLKNPVIHVLKIPTRDYPLSDKYHKQLLEQEYLKNFGHSLQTWISKEGKIFYLYLLQHQRFGTNEDIRKWVTTHEQPVLQESSGELKDDKIPELIFSQSELKRFSEKEQHESSETIIKKRTTERRDSQLVPLFLQRRMSKMNLPSLNSSREFDHNSPKNSRENSINS